MLAARSGIPVSTLSRLERDGEGGLDTFVRLLHALGELDGFHAYVKEQLRKASFPSDIAELLTAKPIRKRVRLRKSKRDGT